MKSSACLSGSVFPFFSVPPSFTEIIPHKCVCWLIRGSSAGSFFFFLLRCKGHFFLSGSVSSLEVYYQPHHVSVRLSVRTSRLTFVKESWSKAEERTHSGLLQSALFKISQLRQWLWKRMLCPCERWIYAPALESSFWSLVGFFVSPCNFLRATK